MRHDAGRPFELGRFVRAFLIALPLLIWSIPAAARQEKKADETKAAAPSPAETSIGQDNNLMYYWRASPTFFVLMSLIAIYEGALVINAFLTFRSKLLIPPALLKTLDGLLAEKKFREAYDAIRTDKSLFARSLSVGAERLAAGYEKATDATLAVVDDGKMSMEHHISPIATIGALGPLLGLLGTVLGMIRAFQEISTGGQPRPAQLAQAIGLALVATLEGLIVAIPATYFFSLFRNKLARLIFDVETLAQDYLFRFSAAVKK